jgi:hypothetical protein
VCNRFEKLFNKRIQQKYLEVYLKGGYDLKILRLFLKKIKMKIDKITIDGFTFNMMTKEDFEQIKP